MDEIYIKTKERDDKMTFEEKKQEKINFTREIRNIKLEKSDIYMNQSDRYSQQQIEELKIYRQKLRDMMQNEDGTICKKQLIFQLNLILYCRRTWWLCLF